MSVGKVTSWRKKVFSPVGLCTLATAGYLYMLTEYFKLEYRVYKERKALEEHDADPTKFNMLIRERVVSREMGKQSQS
ncbi:signal peptide containing protein [Theileria equi strain WA]|uniref:Signal peptide containing protein n=1 Tax=Theileria equi strain WA TaxID=1537102 RepID=L1LF61_THEEQ|nr:signal peptide containing protein [Theileria equi strain WA]EKX73880.1 signal peptide containing protein [Theileria equi strain WA]|eukprot:XP_004833332.1 signal peptide containing protein [Theileria equi strain WA]